MEHPLNAFTMIQRFLTAWQTIDQLIFSTDSFQGHQLGLSFNNLYSPAGGSNKIKYSET